MNMASSAADETRWRIPLVAGRSVHFLELGALACVALYLCFAAAQIALAPPINDEAEYASPALTLLRSGKFATPLFEVDHGTVPGREHVVYYILPGHPLTNLPLLALFGPSVTALRLKPLIFMAGSALLLFKLLGLAGLPRPYPALATALACLNRNWLLATVVARPDAQAFFFGLAGTYLFATRGREQKPLGAAVGGVLIGASVFSHINGVIFAFVCLVIAAYQVGKNFRNPATYAGGLGVLLVVGAYFAFTRLEPEYFHTQINWNANVWDRLDAWSHPFAGTWRELQRWAPFYRTLSPSRLQQVAYLVVNAASLGAIVALSIDRRAPSTLRWIVPTYAVCAVMAFTFFNNILDGYYFFYRTALADVCVVSSLAIVSAMRGPIPKVACGLAVALLFSFHISRDMIFMKNSVEAGRDYRALERAARANLTTADVVTGPPELAFLYGFSPNYLVDENYGFYSGRRPTVLAYWANDLHPTMVESALGGVCIRRDASVQSYLSMLGPVVAAQIERDRARLCAYFRDLDSKSIIVYRDNHYALLRIDGPES